MSYKILLTNGLFVSVLTSFYFTAAYGQLFRIDCLEAQQTCPDPNVKFFLYTSDDPETPVELSVTDVQTIIDAPFVDGDLKLLIHGYTGHKDYSPNREIRPAYFQRNRPVNVISVDYGPLVEKGCYIQGVKNSDTVAMCIAQFLDDLLDIRNDIQLSKIHIIALSLGAQVAGQIQNYLKNGQLERISALDAALPLFYRFVTSNERMIHKGDAKFVDALHTNGGVKGKLLPYADADFYANGGVIQPGCNASNSTCSHERAALLFADSINSLIGFWARRCNYYTFILGYCGDNTNTWALYGEYTNPQARGSFFFDTNGNAPYALSVEESNSR